MELIGKKMLAGILAIASLCLLVPSLLAGGSSGGCAGNGACNDHAHGFFGFVDDGGAGQTGGSSSGNSGSTVE